MNDDFSIIEIKRWAKHVLSKTEGKKDIAERYGILVGEIRNLIEYPEAVRRKARQKFAEVM